MSDMQRLLDSVSNACRESRKPYHLSLGRLRTVLEGLPKRLPVITDSQFPIGREHSYRGYYDDLAFDPGDDPSPQVGSLLVKVIRASQGTYTGYKGGKYTYAEDTPLWLAPYGCLGMAIVGFEIENEEGYRLQPGERPGRLVLLTKDID